MNNLSSGRKDDGGEYLAWLTDDGNGYKFKQKYGKAPASPSELSLKQFWVMFQLHYERKRRL